MRCGWRERLRSRFQSSSRTPLSALGWSPSLRRWCLVRISFLAGLVARTIVGRRIMGNVENSLLGGIPQYQLMKSMAEGLAKVQNAKGVQSALISIDGGWQVVWPILGDLAYRFRMIVGASEMAFDNHGARKYGPEFLTSFSWLYLNALLRACRQVDASLPQLSRYF